VEPGYYWLREDEDEEIVEVWADPEEKSGETLLFIHRCGSGDACEVASLEEVFWAGPLESPAQPMADAEKRPVFPKLRNSPDHYA
jgi:hypothetical protein